MKSRESKACTKVFEMKILALSDIESPALWDYFEKSRLEGIDLILSCGDLDPQYLSFLATFFHGPVLYVHGNHDSSYGTTPPEGCICIDGNLFEYHGIRIVGLGGSMRYKPGPHQYTENQMLFRALKLWPVIARHHGFDLLVTHAPAFGQGDAPDPAHNGFRTFLSMMDRYQPSYHIHGHVHLSYNPTESRVRRYSRTTIVNAYEKYILEL